MLLYLQLPTSSCCGLGQVYLYILEPASEVGICRSSMYNEQTNAHLIECLVYCSLFIAPTCFNANASSSGSSHLVPAKLHKRVHAVLVLFLKTITFFFRIVKTLKQT
jgi:hypothetical protein